MFRAYEKSAQKLRKVLEHGEQELDQAAEDMQENREMLFRQQMDPFRSYVDSDGERYRQIQSQMELSAANGVRLRETEEIVDRLKQEYEERDEEDCLFQRHGSIGMAMEAQFSPSRREKRMNRNNRLWSRYPGW